MRRCSFGMLALALGLLPSPAFAVIGKPVALRDVLAESHFIVVAKVETLDRDKPAATLTISEDLKGKASFRKLDVLLLGDGVARKNDESSKVLKRLTTGQPLVLFVHQRDQEYNAFVYTNGTWFQVLGRKSDDSLHWQ